MAIDKALHSGLRTQAPSHGRPTNLRRFLFGAPYYPEHWTTEDMAQDPERMAAAGFNTVRLAEFAWDRMEPKEGEYDFSFFEYHINRLGEAGISTILCTPTATPPRWLTHRNPHVLRVNHGGLAMTHGSRQHACHSSATFREYSRRITRAMAEYFKGNDNVIGWQTDNELFCHFSECYCENCTAAFRVWLKAKYGCIDELNKAWGNAFWALTYGDFEEVELPRPNRPTHLNPTHVLDYHLFISDEVIAFQKEQVDILKEANPGWFVTHNGQFGNLDYWKFVKDLDFFGVDIYPMFTPTEPRPAHIAFSLDLTRSYGGNFIVPEQQSGPGGQGDYFHDAPQPGQIRLWSYQSIAHGADGVLHFRWRTCRFGAEQYWEGILDHDNIPRRRYDEICLEGKEFAALSDHVLGTTVQPGIGVLHEPGVAEMGHKPITLGLPGPYDNARTVHSTLFKAGYSVGLVNPMDDLSLFKLLILPSWAIITPDTAKALEGYVRDGGTLVVTGRTGHKDERGHVLSVTLPGPLRELTGIEIDEYRKVAEPHLFPNSIELEGTGAEVPLTLWLDTLVPKTAEVIGTWTKGYEEGKPGATLNRYGKGFCVYVGTFPSAEGIMALMPLLSGMTGVAPTIAGCPKGVEVGIRNGKGYRLYFVLNHNAESVAVPGLPEGRDLLTGEVTGPEEFLGLEAYGVAVIRVED